jgi:hypothetical protein
MESLVQGGRLLHGEAAVAVTKAQKIYAKLVWIAAFLIIAGYVADLRGHEWLNLYLCIAFNVGLILWWFQPKNLAVVAGVGAGIGLLPGGRSTESEMKRFVLSYERLLGLLLFWGSVVTFMLWTFPIEGHHSVIIGLVACGLMFVHIKRELKIGSDEFAKRALYTYVCAVTLMLVISLVPNKTEYVLKWTGLYLPQTSISDADKAEVKLLEEDERNGEKERLAKMQPLLDKSSRGERLTEDDKALLKRLRGEGVPQKVSIPSPQAQSVVPATPSAVVPPVTISQRDKDDCTYSRPCEGSTQEVIVPGESGGSAVCFDPPVLSDEMKGVRFYVSPTIEGEMHLYSCSINDIAKGVCKEEIKRFRFAPPNGVKPPRHFFVAYGSKSC